MPVELDPGEGLDVGETVFALALAGEIVAPIEPDVEDAVETLGLVDVPCTMKAEKSGCDMGIRRSMGVLFWA